MASLVGLGATAGFVIGAVIGGWAIPISAAIGAAALPAAARIARGLRPPR